MKQLLFLLLATVIVACNDDDTSSPPVVDQDEVTFTDPANSGGCGNVEIYHYSDDRTYGLRLRGDSAQLALTTDWQTYAVDDSGITLTLYQFSEPLTSFFCDDVIEANEDPVEEWSATEGTIRLRIAQEANEIGGYTVDVELTDMQVDGRRLAPIERSGIEVGGVPG